MNEIERLVELYVAADRRGKNNIMWTAEYEANRNRLITADFAPTSDSAASDGESRHES